MKICQDFFASLFVKKENGIYIPNPYVINSCSPEVPWCRIDTWSYLGVIYGKESFFANTAAMKK
ncbi:MAG: hypothetical protein A2170_05700 [Deltaproteobacteria bacterium RBG_13_53_10]|nr:MAG: hypothetical protein A2170_05700 [Deltaproteobacteria bacterium RBG_13_53_10]